MHGVCFYNSGIYDGGNSTGVMDWRGGEAEDVAISVGEEDEKVGSKRGDGTMRCMQKVYDILGCESLVGHLQRAHGDWATAAKDDGGSLWIGIDVEFSGRSCIAKANCPTHEGNGFDFGQNCRFAANSGSNVCQGAGGHERNIAIGVEQEFDEQVDGVLWNEFDIWFGNIRAIHARFAMNVGSMFCRAHKWAIHAPCNWDITDVCERADFQGILRCFLDCLIARNGGNGKQVYVRVMSSEKYGNSIVVTWVAVEDDFVFHNIYTVQS